MRLENNIRAKDHVWDLKVADVEVGGDIHRIVLGGIKNLTEASALISRDKIIREYDELRKLLISYPYGHDDMCADFIFESSAADAACGYVIMECMGYPYYSGSNTIATAAALLEYDIVPFAEGDFDMTLESPGGLVNAAYRIEDNVIKAITVNGGAAYVMADDQHIDVPGFGTIEYAMVWSGAYYTMVDAEKLGITLTKTDIPKMKAVGAALTEALHKNFPYEHPEFGNQNLPIFVHFTDHHEKRGERLYEGRGATFGAPATIFNCPTGTGTSARMALLASRGAIEEDAIFECISAMEHRFVGNAKGYEQVGPYKTLATTITARPYVLATTTMHIDFDNPLMGSFAKLKDIIC